MNLQPSLVESAPVEVHSEKRMLEVFTLRNISAKKLQGGVSLLRVALGSPQPFSERDREETILRIAGC
jgi:hypothetical protein